ncbi:KpsF/GutQ family sugar-phosphate isomerase [Fodinicurvata sp. EGI_FJ10296]|uniref:KpsF/GutQ family sugar-phosphate isomerase n=1 Tax=Fodinicurvata sp. EGI_FJ10296 TaxID=3231908 RepID=UPI0034535F39
MTVRQQPMPHDNATPDTSAPDADAVAAGRRVLATEIAGLERLAADLGASFAAAVETIMAATGRVIVTGMGKSGHVGRKIAATLASTGTPAFFVHPSEASHGDLGMVTPQDCVMALSNSGGTAELADIIAYCRRFSMPIIAVTGGARSPLAEQATVTLLLPATREACPMGLAPTTSTTMTLALGDALAIALLERRGFSSEDYKIFHPGGALGAQLIKVSEVMHAGDELPLVTPETPMAEAILTMTAKRFGVIGITGADGALAGIVTDGDLRRHMSDTLLQRPVGEIMTTGPRRIGPGALAAEALGVMNTHAITVLFVTDERRQPLGILHIHDVLRAGVA